MLTDIAAAKTEWQSAAGGSIGGVAAGWLGPLYLLSLRGHPWLNSPADRIGGALNPKGLNLIPPLDCLDQPLHTNYMSSSGGLILCPESASGKVRGWPACATFFDIIALSAGILPRRSIPEPLEPLRFVTRLLAPGFWLGTPPQ